jgi:hypothetical protein
MLDEVFFSTFFLIFFWCESLVTKGEQHQEDKGTR